MIRSKNPNSLFLCLVLAALAATGLTSCATKPKAPPAPETATTTEPAATTPKTVETAPAVPQEELDKLLAEAAAGKKRAFDLKLFEILPEDYKAADAAFAAGKTAYDAKDGPAAKEGLSKAVSLFNDLNARGIVELSAVKRKNADDMRATAMKAGAEEKAAERFAPAEASYAEAARLAEAGEHEKAVAAFERARALYELAYKRSLASGLREAIEEKGYAAWDSGNHRLAENKYAEEERLFSAEGGAAELAAGIDSLDEAVLRYNLVVQKGRQGVANGKKETTDEAKARSEGIKADVAVKEGFAEALALYEEGQAKFAAGDYEEAAEAFEKAGLRFEEVYALAAEKRQRAVEAMSAAEAAAEESRRKAEAADQSGGAGWDATSGATAEE